MGICLLVEWFAMQIPCTMVAWYSEHYLVNEPLFRPPFENWSSIHMPVTMVHLKREPSEPLKIDISVSAVQMFTIQIPTVKCLKKISEHVQWLGDSSNH